jgi:hypothetical protein
MFKTRFWPITASPINPISQVASAIFYLQSDSSKRIAKKCKSPIAGPRSKEESSQDFLFYHTQAATGYPASTPFSCTFHGNKTPHTTKTDKGTQLIHPQRIRRFSVAPVSIPYPSRISPHMSARTPESAEQSSRQPPDPILDPIPDPEPASPSLEKPDPGVFHHEPKPLSSPPNLPVHDSSPYNG